MSTLRTIITRYVNLIQKKMNTDEMVYLKNNNKNEFEEKMGEFVPEFRDEYPALFKMILSGADLAMLEIFLDTLDDVDSGKHTFDQARTGLGHLLHNKYVKDKLNK